MPCMNTLSPVDACILGKYAVTLSRPDKVRIKKDIDRMSATQIRTFHKFLIDHPELDYPVVREVLEEMRK